MTTDIILSINSGERKLSIGESTASLSPHGTGWIIIKHVDIAGRVLEIEASNPSDDLPLVRHVRVMAECRLSSFDVGFPDALSYRPAKPEMV